MSESDSPPDHPSKRIDTLVAEHVLGWGKKWFAWVDAENQPMSYTSGAMHHVAFSPSTNISHAWQIFEKFIKDGQPVSIHREDGGWCCRLGTAEIKDEASAPIAICKAALQAKGVEFEG